MSEKTSTTIKILTQKKYWVYLLLALSWLAIGGFTPPADILSSLFAISGILLLYTIFDLIGYEAFKPNISRTPEDNLNLLQSYRILQTMFKVILTGFTWSFFDWKVAGGFWLLSWFGNADLLYYLIGKYSLREVQWTWLKWTPFGMMAKYLDSVFVVIQCLIGWCLLILFLLIINE